MSSRKKRRAAQHHGPTHTAIDSGGGPEQRRVAGAVAAYRGYRLQALYGLHRLLELGPDDVIQPEGVEDVSVLHLGELSEVLQVKALSTPLTLSDLSPRSRASFFQEAAARTEVGGRERLLLVSFGPLGAELESFRAGNAEARASVLRKIVDTGIEHGVAESVLGRLEFALVDEQVVRSSIAEKLGQSLTGVDPSSAFDLLSLWMYRQAESRTRVTVAEAASRVSAVGAFLSERRSHHAEWFVSIVPLDEPTLSMDQREQLEMEFYQGVSVRYEHVAANLAVSRPARLGEIEAAFERERVVVLHAASGQGKTTLAYLFMRALPDSWRFTVKAIEGRAHALQVARALTGHALAMDLPLYVHVDVGPRDLDWPTLVRELSVHPQIRVLVTIREEDWRRSSDVGTFLLADVDPTFDEGEAREIYQSLRGRFPDAPATFEEAWARFGTAGPLLEFVHLVTQRQELKARLSDQMRRLRDESVMTGDDTKIEFLRRVAVASAGGARLRLKPLADDVALPDPDAVIVAMEREFLLRVSDDRSLVGGLHPIRSQLLRELLTDDVLAPWQEQLRLALPFVAEDDLETFLLHVLEQDPSNASLREGLFDLRPESWVGYAGVARALRWRGVADYADAHRELIEEIDPGHSGRWTIMLDTDIADAGPDVAERMMDVLGRLDSGGRAVEAMRRFRARQRPKREAFKLLRRWLDRPGLPHVPSSSADWGAFGEMMFFARRLEVTWDPPWLLPDALDDAVEAVSLEDTASLSMGMESGGELRRSWLERNRAKLVERFRRSADAVTFQDDGTEAHIDFIFPVRESEVETAERSRSAGAVANSEAVWRLDLLRRVLPDREHYGSQGWGHRVAGIPVDDTQKRIPSGGLVPLWLSSTNAGLRGYVERWWRSDTWSAYEKLETRHRESVRLHLEALTRAVVTYHRRARAHVLGELLTEAWFKEWDEELQEETLLPLPAVDRYGLVDESAARVHATDTRVMPHGLALLPYAPYVRARREFLRTLSNFAQQAPKAAAFAGVLGRTAAEARGTKRVELVGIGLSEEMLRLSALNMRDAMKALPAYQEELAALFPAVNYQPLELRERRAFRRAVAAWDLFVRVPWRHSEDIADEGISKLDRATASWKQDLHQRLQTIDADMTWTVEAVDAGTGYLLIEGSAEDGVVAFTVLEEAVRTIHDSLTQLRPHVASWMQSCWPKVVVIPLVRGRTLASEAIELSTLVVSGGDWQPEWWHLVPKPLASPLRARSELQPWSTADLALGNRMGAAVGALFAHATHLRDLPDEARLDSLGRELLATHRRRIEPSAGRLWRRALAECERLRAAVDGIPAGTIYRGSLGSALTDLIALLRNAPGWPEKTDPTPAELEGWSDDLASSVALAGAIRLNWATAILATR